MAAVNTMIFESSVPVRVHHHAVSACVRVVHSPVELSVYEWSTQSQ